MIRTPKKPLTREEKERLDGLVEKLHSMNAFVEDRRKATQATYKPIDSTSPVYAKRITIRFQNIRIATIFENGLGNMVIEPIGKTFLALGPGIKETEAALQRAQEFAECVEIGTVWPSNATLQAFIAGMRFGADELADAQHEVKRLREKLDMLNSFMPHDPRGYMLHFSR